MGRPRINPPKTTKVEPPRVRSIDDVTLSSTTTNDMYLVVPKTSVSQALKTSISILGTPSSYLTTLDGVHKLTAEQLADRMVLKIVGYAHIEKTTEVVDVKEKSISQHLNTLA